MINRIQNKSFVYIIHVCVQFICIMYLHTLTVLCPVCHVSPPLVSLFGLFPVFIECDNELILAQLCLSHYPVYL